MPSIDDYRLAFLAVRSQMTENQLEMLRAHYAAPGHATTMSKLAKAVGYSSYSSANLQYGKLARSVAHRLGFAKDRTTGQSQYLDALAAPARDQDPNDDWKWVLRQEVVSALEALEWVKPECER